MKKNTVVSSDGTKTIEIVERESGFYGLICYVKKYDSEEDCNYTVRVLPDPGGIFGDITSATIEANRILTL